MRARVMSLGIMLTAMQSACLLPGHGAPKEPSVYVTDESVMRSAKLVRRAYLKPGTDLRSFGSIRIPDFQDYTGKSVDPQALQLLAESLAAALQELPPNLKPFERIDRQGRVDPDPDALMLKGALTVYEINVDRGSLTRLGNQVVVAVECQILDTKTGAVVALIQHRAKQGSSETGYQNPVRAAIERLGQDMAQWLAAPELGSEDEEQDE